MVYLACRGGQGVRGVLEEVVLQELGLTRTGLILARFQGYHVVERSRLHSCQNSSRQHSMKISRVSNQRWVVSGLGTVPVDILTFYNYHTTNAISE